MQTTVQEPPVKQGAVIGGWICFVLGLLTMFLSLRQFFIYGPLFLVAFILSIVAMSQKRIAGGLALLLLSLVVPPVLWFGLTATRGTAALERANKSLQEELRRLEERNRQTPTPPPTLGDAVGSPSPLPTSMTVDEIRDKLRNMPVTGRPEDAEKRAALLKELRRLGGDTPTPGP